ncbi:MAG: hypothetical protein ACM36B_02325 [Bacteroidota bacterium]|jgi:hypothetical protein
MKIPLHVIVVDASGAIATALGLWAALGDGGAALPVLANPRVAWSLVAIGVLMMVYAGVAIVRIALDRQRRRGPGEQ